MDGLTSTERVWASGSVLAGKLMGTVRSPVPEMEPEDVTGLRTPLGLTGRVISRASLSSLVRALASRRAVPIDEARSFQKAVASPFGLTLTCWVAPLTRSRPVASRESWTDFAVVR